MMLAVEIMFGFFLTGAALNLLNACRGIAEKRLLTSALSVIGFLVCSLAALLMLARFGPNVFLPAECRGAPTEVPYSPGMRLCPGQSAIVVIELPAPQDGKDI